MWRLLRQSRHGADRDIPVPPIVDDTIEVQVTERIQEQIEEQLIAEETTKNTMEIPVTSSTSTISDRRLDEFANMLDSRIELLTPLTTQIETSREKTERVAMLTKRMMELPVMEPPLMEPPVMECTWPQARGSLRDAPDLVWTPLACARLI